VLRKPTAAAAAADVAAQTHPLSVDSSSTLPEFSLLPPTPPACMRAGAAAANSSSDAMHSPSTVPLGATATPGGRGARLALLLPLLPLLLPLPLPLLLLLPPPPASFVPVPSPPAPPLLLPPSPLHA
jgi:hypothetical protein